MKLVTLLPHIDRMIASVARGLSAGADAYLAKPFSVAGLVSQIRTLTGLDGVSERQPA